MRSYPRHGLLIVLILLALSGGTELDGAVYYVDQSHPNANDNNVGSEDYPWLTVKKAAGTLVAGDTVYIKNGIYNEVVSVAHSGSAGKAIVFQGYPGHTAVLDGTGHGGWYGVFSVYGKDYIRVEGLEVRNNSTGWGVLVEHDGGDDSSNIELINLEVHHTGGEAIQIRGNAHDILIQDCLVHHGANYSGIDIYQWNSGRPHHVAVVGCTAYEYPGFAGIASEQADFLLVDDNVVYDSSLGIDIGSGDSNIIRNNIVRDCDTGIALSSNEDSEIYNNIISDIYDEAIYCYYWIYHGEDHARNEWHHNIVYNAGFAVYESNQKTSGHGTGPTSDHKYHDNIFYNVGTGSYRTPFYFRGTTELKFINNTLYMNDDNDAIELLSGAVDNDIRNNIISISGNKAHILIDGSSTPGSLIDYNCYHNRNGGSTLIGNHSIIADPLFVSVGTSLNGDYHLTYSSPCRDLGDDSAVLDPEDFEGDPRIVNAAVDMGADEFHTHLYYRGDAAPGGSVDLKLIDIPYTAPVILWLGSGVLDPPLHLTKYGDWYLQVPILLELPLGAIPSPDGVLVMQGTVPSDVPSPLELPFQALIADALTNLSVMKIE